MLDTALRAAVMILCLLLGVMAGFFFAFSNTVMPGLDLMPGPTATQAMQNINIAVRNPVFFAVFAATPILGTVLAVVCLINVRHRRTGLLLLLSAAIYIGGVVVLTAGINVPMNRALGLLSGLSTQEWLQWSADWTVSNHVRTVVSILSLLFAILAACRVTGQGQDGVARSPG